MKNKTLQQVLNNMEAHVKREQTLSSLIPFFNYIAPIAFILNLPTALISGIWLLSYAGGMKLVLMAIISWYIVPYIMGFLTYPAKFFLDIKYRKLSSILIALIHWVVASLWCYFAIAEEIIYGYSLLLGHIPTIALCISMGTLPIWRMMQDFFIVDKDELGAVTVIILSFVEIASLLSILIFFMFFTSNSIQDIRFVVVYTFIFVGIFEISFHSKILMEIFYHLDYETQLESTIHQTQEANEIQIINLIHEPEQPKLNKNINIKPKVSEQTKIISTTDNITSEEDIVNKLICIGLAHVGRKTQYNNKYLTNEITIERVSVEKPFLDLLKHKFTNDKQRKIIQDNFMLFKETCLYMIYDVVLGNDKQLFERIKIELQSILSKKLFLYGIRSRQEYSTIFKGKFYDKFSKTENMNKSLRFAFWSTLAAKYPDWITLQGIADILNNDYLFRIFKYSYTAIEAEYNAYQASLLQAQELKCDNR